MVLIFSQPVPLSLIRPNTFLFLIAILSFYFALAGRRYATNRRGSPRPLDWGSASVMALRRWDYDNFWRLPAQPPQYERDHDDHPWWHWRGAQHRGSPCLTTGWCE